jgi:hypothetical protein
MKSTASPSTPRGPWISLWVVALLSLIAQLWMCQFFSFGEKVPVSIDINPSNLWGEAYTFPPNGTFQVLNWLGVAFTPKTLNPLSLAAATLSPWWFFTTYAPVMATLAFLAMVAFLREFEISRPASLFGGLIFAWQGDLLPFIYPGHFAYIATWPLFALGAWAALRAQRTRQLGYPLISGACCGLMVGLQPDRGGICSLLIAALYLAAIFLPRHERPVFPVLRDLFLCIIVAAAIALAPLLALFQTFVVGVKLAGSSDPEQTYKLVTQYCIAPVETLTYLVPGFFGWHTNSVNAQYWGWIGEWPDWPKTHQGSRNFNLGISTTGTLATVLALLGAGLLTRLIPGGERFSMRQRFFGRILLALGIITLILSWGWHTGLYRPLVALPLMDKWRNPLKWLEMTNLAIPLLSAIGMEYLLASLDSAAPDLHKIRRSLAWFTTTALVLLAVGFVASFPLALILLAGLQAEGCDPADAAKMMFTMHLAMFVALVSVALFCLVLRLLWIPEKLRTVKMVNPILQTAWDFILQPIHLPLTLVLSLGLLAVAQLGWVAAQFVEPVPLAYLTASNPLLEALQHEGNTVRVAVPTDDPFLKDNLLHNQFIALRLSSLDISAASRIPDDYNDFLNTLADNEGRLWFLAGVKNVAVPQDAIPQIREVPSIAANIDRADGYTLIPTGSPDLPSHALIVMKDYLAKATFVPGVEFLADNKALLARLKDPAWDPRATVILQKPVVVTVPGALPATNTSAAAADSVDLQTYTPTDIQIEAHTTRSGFVLINDQYNPDWQVHVNGHAVPLLRADDMLRAIAIPAGTSQITLHYATRYHLGSHNLPAVAVNLFSDAALLVSVLFAFLNLRRTS